MFIENKKGGVVTIYELILSERNRLDKQIHSLQKQLKDLPTGKLICARNENRYKWYRSDGHESKYLSKKERHMAERLAVKKYLSLLLEDALQEKQAIDFYLRHHKQNVGKAEKLLTESSGYQELLLPYFQPLNQELLNWMNSPFQQNEKHPEQLVHRTVSGYFVRSKSELLIDMILRTNKLPYRYECALSLGESVIYPDFTIRHPHTGKIFYWEHFGKMDDPAYCRTVCTKMNLYTSHGIVPGIQLITTYETRECPLGPEKIERIIQEYFKSIT